MSDIGPFTRQQQPTRFRTIQVYPKDLPILVWQAEYTAKRPTAGCCHSSQPALAERLPSQKEADNGYF
jgi:hypothetical protein